jgi:hypothetical protein
MCFGRNQILASHDAHTPTPSSRPQAVGFDMDYTIAQYKPKPFEELAYRWVAPFLSPHLSHGLPITPGGVLHAALTGV